MEQSKGGGAAEQNEPRVRPCPQTPSRQAKRRVGGLGIRRGSGGGGSTLAVEQGMNGKNK